MGKVSDSGTPPPYLQTDTSRPSPADQIRFIANVERILAEGSFVATYKYALLVALVELALAARALTHFSGSFRRIWMNTQRKAGIAPMRKANFHEFSGDTLPALISPPIHMLINPAVMLPTADKADAT